MITTGESLEKYQDVFLKEGIQLSLLGQSRHDFERLKIVFTSIDSMFLFPTEHESELNKYLEKLIDHGFNFVLTDGGCDIGLLSVYANNQITKIAYTSTIGITPSHRKGALGRNLVKFGLEFLKEIGMRQVKAEIHKNNAIWLRYLQRLKFEIESEKEDGNYVIVREL